MAFLCQTPAIDEIFKDIRARAMNTHVIFTTLSYGPRFLHSTGQLHKGGPNNGLFLQITAEHTQDIPIPGKPYTFGVLADAQALGDLRALENMGRRVLRLHLGTDIESGLRQISSRNSIT